MTAPARYVLEVLGAPPRKNRRHVVARGQVRNSPEFEELVFALAAAWGTRPRLVSGLWRVTIVGRWPRIRTLDDGTRVPFGDVDAPVSSAHDALQRAGVFDDDMRIAELVARREHSPERPGLRIEIERVAEPETP